MADGDDWVLAAHRGDTKLLRTLLEAVANILDVVRCPELRYCWLTIGRTCANNVGASALFIGSRAGHIAVVELLFWHSIPQSTWQNRLE